MKRSELREIIFKRLFMAQFHSQAEMTEQLKLYFKFLAQGREHTLYAKGPTATDEIYIKEKYTKIVQKLLEIDSILNETAIGFDTPTSGCL